ncbi:histidine kinase [Uliginosibacterium sp. H3]|uniref:Histidine kinase n=1 Tax=Uliginosibacterium silvisoli TaxID=3114758 RepID=A0ABU6K7G1_9RHOO|nr:histidine kinase [Uliginosibacterium sp. H3]
MSMRISTPFTADSEKAFWWPSMRRLLFVFVGSSIIAALLWATKGRPFVPCWIFSQCVGMSICFVFTAVHHFSPPRFGHVPAILLGVLLGYPVGIFIAKLLGSGAAAAEVTGDGYALLRYAVAGLIFTAAFSYFFHSRMRIVELERARQEAELRETTGQKTALLAELRLLQAQIEPHFLFNTLANLHSLIGRDDALAKQLLEQLNDYLRASLVHSRARQATLGDEMDMLTAYCAIQRLRMGERLQTRIEIDPALRSVAFPPMLLQPLVENAMIHGIEPKLGAGEVQIRVTREAGMLHIVVQDDGVGFAASSAGGQGVGLSNVRERLAALFGGQARIEVRENVPAGVVVALWIPGEGSQ